MRHGSLFSGIGGFDLAAQWLGWENVFHCEWNSFGQRVLKHYWPDADSHHDITKTNFTQYANRIDILTGGFPCQPYSGAGKRKGKEDERHLWPEMLRTIREVAPRYVVGENVLGLTNWNGGVVFDEVHSDLEFEGYEVAAVVIPAAAVNAPHGRDRVWFVARRNAADAAGDGFNQRNGGNEIDPSQRGVYALRDAHASDGDGNATDAVGRTSRSSRTRGGVESNGGEQHEFSKKWGVAPKLNHGFHKFSSNATDATRGSIEGQYIEQPRTREFRGRDSGNEFNNFENFPTQPAICGGNDGLPDQLDGITFSKWRNESLKAYGNAIVPQVAFEIFKVIQKIENGETS